MDLLGAVKWFFPRMGAYRRTRSPRPEVCQNLGFDIAEKVATEVHDTGWDCKEPLQEKRCICSWYGELTKSGLTLKYTFLPCHQSSVKH